MIESAGENKVPFSVTGQNCFVDWLVLALILAALVLCSGLDDRGGPLSEAETAPLLALYQRCVTCL